MTDPWNSSAGYTWNAQSQNGGLPNSKTETLCVIKELVVEYVEVPKNRINVPIEVVAPSDVNVNNYIHPPGSPIRDETFKTNRVHPVNIFPSNMQGIHFFVCDTTNSGLFEKIHDENRTINYSLHAELEYHKKGCYDLNDRIAFLETEVNQLRAKTNRFKAAILKLKEYIYGEL